MLAFVMVGSVIVVSVYLVLIFTESNFANPVEKAIRARFVVLENDYGQTEDFKQHYAMFVEAMGLVKSANLLAASQCYFAASEFTQQYSQLMRQVDSYLNKFAVNCFS